MCESIWNLGSIAIDENRFYEPRLYVQFPSSETWKRSFFKEAYHWRVDLDFVSKCIENALDLRTIDLQLSRNLDFAKPEESFFIHLLGLEMYNLLWAPFSR